MAVMMDIKADATFEGRYFKSLVKVCFEVNLLFNTSANMASLKNQGNDRLQIFLRASRCWKWKKLEVSEMSHSVPLIQSSDCLSLLTLLIKVRTAGYSSLCL